jgi:hypothetical protein
MGFRRLKDSRHMSSQRIKMENMMIQDELEVIDQTISELEGRRVEIINRMEKLKDNLGSGKKVIPFPKPAIAVISYTSPRHVW